MAAGASSRAAAALHILFTAGVRHSRQPVAQANLLYWTETVGMTQVLAGMPHPYADFATALASCSTSVDRQDQIGYNGNLRQPAGYAEPAQAAIRRPLNDGFHLTFCA
jgi:hypothetical protein